MKFEFSENNSGGSWWLKREQYEALFAAGWKYEPSAYDKEKGNDTKPFFAGGSDTVPYDWRHGLTAEFDSMKAAVENWEKATGENFFEEGCNCCGAPYSISSDGEYMSGDSVDREVVRPW